MLCNLKWCIMFVNIYKQKQCKYKMTFFSSSLLTSVPPADCVSFTFALLSHFSPFRDQIFGLSNKAHSSGLQSRRFESREVCVVRVCVMCGLWLLLGSSLDIFLFHLHIFLVAYLQLRLLWHISTYQLFSTSRYWDIGLVAWLAKWLAWSLCGQQFKSSYGWVPCLCVKTLWVCFHIFFSTCSFLITDFPCLPFLLLLLCAGKVLLCACWILWVWPRVAACSCICQLVFFHLGQVFFFF